MRKTIKISAQNGQRVKNAGSSDVKQIAKIIGVRMSKQLFSKGLSKVIPLIGAAISGAMTYAAFGSSAESLRKHLEENSRFFRGEGYMEKA